MRFGPFRRILCFGDDVNIGNFHYATRHFCYFHIHSIRVQHCVTRFFFLISWTLMFIWSEIIAILVKNMISSDAISSGRLHDYDTDNRSIAIDFHVHSAGAGTFRRDSSSIYSFHREKHCSCTLWEILYEFRCSISYKSQSFTIWSASRSIRRPIFSRLGLTISQPI